MGWRAFHESELIFTDIYQPSNKDVTISESALNQPVSKPRGRAAAGLRACLCFLQES
jgi:hypothetical protein